MRLSSNYNSPYYSHVARRATVMFNGKKLLYCVEADGERGRATITHHDSKGRVVFNRDRSGALTVVLHGDVRIVLGEST